MNRFEQLRFEKGLTQQEVADGANISRATVIRLERARAPKPTSVVVRALASFYGVDIADLLPADHDSRAAA